MTGDIWAITGSIATVLALIFSIYIHFQNHSVKETEKAKIKILQERLSGLHFQITSAVHSVDSIVQISKHGQIPTETLQHMARLSRGQLFTILKQLEVERDLLNDWKYGKLIESSEQQMKAPPPAT